MGLSSQYFQCSRKQPYDPTITGKLSHFPRRKVHLSDMTAVYTALAGPLPRFSLILTGTHSMGTVVVYTTTRTKPELLPTSLRVLTVVQGSQGSRESRIYGCRIR